MKQKKLIRLLLPAAVLAALLLALLLRGRQEEGGQVPSPAAPTAGPTAAATEPAPTTAPAPAPTEPEQTAGPTEPQPTAPPPVTRPSQTEPAPGEPSGTEPTGQTGAEQLEWPYLIPGTDLVVLQVSPYDGLLLEDGQDVEVTNVCSIVVCNTGGRDLEYAQITLDRDGTALEFRVSGLTAGSSALVQEYRGAAYAPGSYRSCSASAAVVDGFELSRELVEVTENGDGSLTVTNLTGETIPCVRVFYKFYMADVDVYLGGITYTAKLEELAAGASQQIRPSHFLAGMSRIVMIKTYDTAQ